MKKIYIYLHVACIGSWKEVVGKIQSSIKESGLYDKVCEIRCSVIGDKDNFLSFINHDKKYKIIFNSNEPEFVATNWHTQLEYLDLSKISGKKKNLSWKDIFYSSDDLWKEDKNHNDPKNRPIHNEQIILKQLHEDALKEDFYALYIHSKGVKRSMTDPHTYPYIQDWVDYLLYFNVHKHKIAIDELDEFDVCGVNLFRFIGECQSFHYGGNFWWTKSEYLKTLNPKLRDTYNGPEVWVLQNIQAKLISLFNSNVNHYSESFPQERYINKNIQRYEVKDREKL